MAKTKQNKVPFEFDSLYLPIVQLKKILQSKTKEITPNQALRSLIMLHFATFVMSKLHHRAQKDSVRDYEIRALVENVLAQDSYKFTANEVSSLFSYIDAIAKMLNTTAKPYIYIAMYQAYLNSLIYRELHPNLGIYDFIELQTVQTDTVSKMKHYHDASLILINEVSTRAKERGLINADIR